MAKLPPPIRVHISQEYDVYCGRPSKYGNPFSHRVNTLAEFKTGYREESITKHYRWLSTNLELRKELKELSGKRLACFCKKTQSCHVDSIIAIFNLEYNIKSIF